MKNSLLFFFLLMAALGCAQSTQISFDPSWRLLLLDGEDGSVACRVYGPLMGGTIPRFSDNGTLESASRSFLRMKNLTAVRGVPGAGMVGPVDYLGNLEDPHRYLYTIQNGFPPVFYRQPITDQQEPVLKKLDPQFITVVTAHWISGLENDLLERKREEYHSSQTRFSYSLFLDPGLLEIDRDLIELPSFDPIGVDLSPFKARLVDHTVPFRMTRRELPPKDDYRLVTYLYEPLYSDWQVQQGNGLFLEKHRFSQSITPLTADSTGFVVLAKRNENPQKLELIGVQIPYGYTLIIEEGCIHGDTTLNGFFMMGMTSDHTTMRTADTVFLKCPETKRNVKIVLAGKEEGSHPISWTAPDNAPYVLYRNATEQDREIFRRRTAGQNFIFNPFCELYWRR